LSDQNLNQQWNKCPCECFIFLFICLFIYLYLEVHQNQIDLLLFQNRYKLSGCPKNSKNTARCLIKIRVMQHMTKWECKITPALSEWECLNYYRFIVIQNRLPLCRTNISLLVFDFHWTKQWITFDCLSIDTEIFYSIITVSEETPFAYL
jgi:hypothetical protein